MKRHSLFILSIFLLSACATTARKHEKLPPLYGIIFDQENRPVADAELSLDGNYAATSDVHGHFSLLDVKKGDSHVIQVSKKGYERVEVEISYVDAAQVLYVSMHSADQLIAKAEQAIKEKDWKAAESFLARAEKTGAEAVSLSYLKAVLAMERKDIAMAEAILLGMVAGGSDEPHVFLFLADIYQYAIKDNDKAREYLSRFLKFRSDPEVEARYETLSRSPTLSAP